MDLSTLPHAAAVRESDEILQGQLAQLSSQLFTCSLCVAPWPRAAMDGEYKSGRLRNLHSRNYAAWDFQRRRYIALHGISRVGGVLKY
jgi:hypothetical protein